MDYSQREFRYHKKDCVIPDGWELAHDLLDCHHGRHAIIIEKRKEKLMDKELQAIKDAYLNLGVALSEYLKSSETKKTKTTGIQDLVWKCIQIRPDDIHNLHAVARQIDMPTEPVGKAMQRLCVLGKIERVGLGTYKVVREG